MLPPLPRCVTLRKKQNSRHWNRKPQCLWSSFPNCGYFIRHFCDCSHYSLCCFDSSLPPYIFGTVVPRDKWSSILPYLSGLSYSLAHTSSSFSSSNAKDFYYWRQLAFCFFSFSSLPTLPSPQLHRTHPLKSCPHRTVRDSRPLPRSRPPRPLTWSVEIPVAVGKALELDIMLTRNSWWWCR